MSRRVVEADKGGIMMFVARAKGALGWRAGLLALSAVSIFAVCSRADADDVFNGCTKNSTGRLRPSSVLVNATPACKANETPRTWNQSGQPGPTGPSDAFATYADEVPLPASGNFLTLAQLTLPAGQYVVTARGNFINSNAAVAAIPYCTIKWLSFLGDQAQAIINGTGETNLVALSTPDLPSGGTIEFRCTNNTNSASDGDVVASTVRFVAVRVGTLTLQPPLP
jgi:hypothetical protein